MKKAYTNTHEHTQIHTSTQAHKHTQANTNKHEHTQTHISTHQTRKIAHITAKKRTKKIMKKSKQSTLSCLDEGKPANLIVMIH